MEKTTLMSRWNKNGTRFYSNYSAVWYIASRLWGRTIFTSNIIYKFDGEAYGLLTVLPHGIATRHETPVQPLDRDTPGFEDQRFSPDKVTSRCILIVHININVARTHLWLKHYNRDWVACLVKPNFSALLVSRGIISFLSFRRWPCFHGTLIFFNSQAETCIIYARTLILFIGMQLLDRLTVVTRTFLL